MTKNSVNREEIKHFAKDSAHWWNENGPFKPLHRLNPVRLSYIKQQICQYFGREMNDLQALKGLRILDVGCGGGLICEPLARLGATITGLDADASAITVAKEHAAQNGLDIIYENGAIEDIQSGYDIVLALEIIEHIDDPQSFVQACGNAVNKGGIMIASTLNRNAKSYALGIVTAEYLLRWVPRGTHNWNKFLKPSEFAHYMRDAALNPQDVTGLIFNPLQGAFSLSENDIDVNYLITACKTL